MTSIAKAGPKPGGKTGSTPTGTWVERYGRIAKLVRRTGKNGAFVTFDIDCRTFVQAAVAFDHKAVDALLAAGIGGQVWIKGPVELREITRDGAVHQEETVKAVYFGIRNQKPAGDTEAARPSEATHTALVPVKVNLPVAA